MTESGGGRNLVINLLIGIGSTLDQLGEGSKYTVRAELHISFQAAWKFLSVGKDFFLLHH